MLALGAAHVVIEMRLDLSFSRAFNALVLTGCLLYLAWRLSTTKDLLRVWGMRADNFAAALRAQLFFFVPATAVLLFLFIDRVVPIGAENYTADYLKAVGVGLSVIFGVTGILAPPLLRNPQELELDRDGG